MYVGRPGPWSKIQCMHAYVCVPVSVLRAGIPVWNAAIISNLRTKAENTPLLSNNAPHSCSLAWSFSHWQRQWQYHTGSQISSGRQQWRSSGLTTRPMSLYSINQENFTWFFKNLLVCVRCWFSNHSDDSSDWFKLAIFLKLFVQESNYTCHAVCFQFKRTGS